MNKIKIYSSKKKSFRILILSLLFVVFGLILVIYDKANSFTCIVGILGILFFGMGVLISMRLLIKNRLLCTIDETGINLRPEKPDEIIKWININGFRSFNHKGTKIIVIDVNNPQYWIDRENNMVRKNLMKFNVAICDSPFCISTNSSQTNHKELLELLNSNRIKYNLERF